MIPCRLEEVEELQGIADADTVLERIAADAEEQGSRGELVASVAGEVAVEDKPRPTRASSQVAVDAAAVDMPGEANDIFGVHSGSLMLMDASLSRSLALRSLRRFRSSALPTSWRRGRGFCG